MTGDRYRDPPPGTPSATPPGPYSEHAVAALVAHRDARIRELEAELARLREVEAAARALVGALTYGKDSGDAAGRCYRCGALATYALHKGRAYMAHGCDRCNQHGLRAEELTYAPAWRRLRKVVER